MKGISTSICADSICYHKRPIVVDAKSAISNCIESGFKTLDFSFHNYARDGQPMAEANWEDWLREIRSYADKLDVTWHQGHAFIYPKDGTIDQHNDVYEERIRRSIVGCGIMGVKVLVLHPRNFFIDDDFHKSYDAKRSKDANIRYIEGYLKEVEKIPNLKLAIENLFLPATPQKDNRYCSCADELVDLVETINSPRVGICWDFGHANISGQNQVESLEKVKKHLIATHVHDNAGTIDEHLAPFFGRMDWFPIMEKLKEIDYKGYFTLEIQHFAGGLPPEPGMRMQALKLSHDVAEYLYSL
ncbi:MAG: sugar phosphate isomerase/epimerase [Spirochaetales bacterium]|nr:sugar phosphate isomerase/epimerase [Spirochaetales bacterium]